MTSGADGADTTDDGWQRLRIPGLIPPGLIDAVRGGVTGTVTENGAVEIDVMGGQTLRPDEDAPAPGTEMYVTIRKGNLWGRPQAEHERRQQQRQQRRQRRQEMRERAKERAKAWRKRRAEAFWRQYDIPVDHQLAIKGRRSGLLKDSRGDGRAADTVEHLYVLEGFEDGRLARDADTYLCDPSTAARFEFTEGIDRTGPDGESYRPPVTCQECLRLMARWKQAPDSDGGDGAADEVTDGE